MTDAATKEKPARTTRFKRDQKITLLADKENKPYGAKNNPKRAGSKSAERFALYKNGMTIDEFVKAGGRSADVTYDVDHNYISVA